MQPGDMEIFICLVELIPFNMFACHLRLPIRSCDFLGVFPLVGKELLIVGINCSGININVI